MQRSPRQRALYLLALAFAAAPVAFALVRAFRTGSDLRMLWMAMAAFIGASAVMKVGKPRDRSSRGLLLLAGAAMLLGMLLAGGTALLAGARAAAGIWPVAFVLAFCWSASYAFDALSRPRSA